MDERFLPYGRQQITEEDIQAVVDVLRSDFITQGPRVDDFEEQLAAVTEAEYAVCFSSGTAALHAAAVVAGLGPGDRVATSALTFLASVNCARYVGATPVLIDIDPDTMNMDPKRMGNVDAVVAVHYAGLPIDLAELPSPRVVIEDASHALGSHTPEGPVGNCARSDMTTLSFHPVKAITTGEGGAVTTNSAKYADALRRFRSHGIQRGEVPWEYDVVMEGYNYRLSDIHAALGMSQLKRLAGNIASRNVIADRYDQGLIGDPIVRPPRAPQGCVHARHLYPVQVERRDDVIRFLRDKRIGAQVHYIPPYRFGNLRDLGFTSGDFTNTERISSRLISLPIYPALTEEDQSTVIACLREAIARLN